jgi:hypothetical protein
MRKKLVVAGLASLVFGIVVACGTEGESHFVELADAGPDGSSGNVPNFSTDGSSGSSSGDPDGSLGTCAAGCAQGAHCKYGVCVPDLGSCTTNDTCPGDSYCDPSDHTCVPYGVPEGKINDPTCTRSPLPGVVTPTVQCEWSAPSDTATKDFVNVYTTPVVADLNLDLDPNKLQPSVVVTTWKLGDNDDRVGMLRVFDGRTCKEQMRIGGPDDPEVDANRVGYGTQLAIGDLDGDLGQKHGHPEIVALHRLLPLDVSLTTPKLNVIAYAIDSSAVETGGKPKLVRKWVGKDCANGDTPLEFGSNSDNYGPNIWDIDDDGNPEVIVDKNVFDGKTGCLLNPVSPGTAQYEPFLNHGAITTVADVDLDGQPDLVRADGVYGWDKTAKNWVLKPYFVQNATTQKHGHIAVADLGFYSDIPGHTKTEKFPEIIIVSPESPLAGTDTTGTVRVQDLRGNIVFGPVPIFTTEADDSKKAYNGGHGGPPTASDFDGDGQVEFAAAANAYYTIYDPDCEGVPKAGGDGAVSATARPGGKCIRADYMKNLDDTKLPLQKGILWAQPSSDYSSSETGSSIFDFNGDGKSEAVYRDECYLRVYEGATGNVIFSAPASSGTGQEYPVICDADGDFATEIVVTRANNGPDCPAQDPLASPDAGAPAFSKKGGFMILRDPLDRWLASRPVWNQHAYSITNVNDNASIPKASDVKRNWEQPGLDNFRQNTQGTLSSLALADLTAQISDLSQLCSNTSGTIPLSARVCNRGTNPVQDGVTIAFYGAPKNTSSFDAAGAKLICEDVTKTLLDIGQCTTINCTGTVPTDVDVYVVTDPAGKVADCHPGNNNGASARVLCPVVK